MLPNKQNNNTATRSTASPLMPTLAAHCRTTRSPHTPRLATTASPIKTPSSRRGPHNDSTRETLRGGSREQISTPVKAFLNSNVTPRSSSRTSRGGSAHSTPTGTPNGTPISVRPATTIGAPASRDRANPSIQSHPSQEATCGSRRKSKSLVDGIAQEVDSSTERQAPVSRLKLASGADGRGDRTFFRADEASPKDIGLKTSTATAKKSTAFFYANGEQENLMRGESRIPSPPLSTAGQDNSASKFFYADGTEEVAVRSVVPSPPSMTSSPSSSVLASPVQPFPPFRPPLRPPSPLKENIHLSYRKGASQIIRPAGNRLSNVSALPSLANVKERRRSSLEPPIGWTSHHKSASFSSVDSPDTLRNGGFAKFAADSPTSSPSIVSRPASMEAAILLPQSRTEDDVKESGVEVPCNSDVVPSSPAKLGFSHDGIRDASELAANARRERKVLDLEISNSSLLAINRQLEREVRKQKVELRRFRRLSRSGRFSLMTARSSSGGQADGAHAAELSDMAEETDEEEREEEDEEELSDDLSIDEDALSPRTLADADARHRARDEKRLRLDLSKHRELLVDSQKLNQGLKRCLDWTEELIHEGKKALEYKVRVSDVKLGGRVLRPEERDEANEDSEELHGLQEDYALSGSLSPEAPNLSESARSYSVTDDPSAVEDVSTASYEAMAVVATA